jgi:hypothetical protein
MTPPIIPGVPLRFQMVIEGEVAGLNESQLAGRLIASISWNAWLAQYMRPMKVEIAPAPLPGPQLVKPGG